jgi:hypothetical protein
MLKTRRLILVVFIVALCAFPAAGLTERTVTEAGAEGIIIVRLSFPERTIGGLTEEIPEGYEFAGTGHPAEQTLVEGKNLHFAVIGEEEIVYSLKGTGKPEITGTWIDLASEGNESAVETRAAPGFGFLAGIIALVFAVFTGRREL